MKQDEENRHPPIFSENLRPKKAAEYSGVSESKLAKLRMKGNRSEGPRFSKIAGCVVYRRPDLDEWIAANIVAAD